jgi:hypothetical protein
MPTNTAGTIGLEYHTNQVHYLAKTVTNADDDLVVTIGYLPPGAVVIDAGIVITTAFAGGSPVADMGAGADTDAFASALVLTTAGAIRDVSTNPLVANDDYSATAAIAVNISITSGSTITAGSGVAFVTYIVPRG